MTSPALRPLLPPVLQDEQTLLFQDVTLPHTLSILFSLAMGTSLRDFSHGHSLALPTGVAGVRVAYTLSCIFKWTSGTGGPSEANGAHLE